MPKTPEGDVPSLPSGSYVWVGASFDKAFVFVERDEPRERAVERSPAAKFGVKTHWWRKRSGYA